MTSRGHPWDAGKSAKKPRTQGDDVEDSGRASLPPSPAHAHAAQSPPTTLERVLGGSPANAPSPFAARRPAPGEDFSPQQLPNNVIEAATAFNRLRVRATPASESSPSISAAGHPPSPKKRKAVASLQEESSLLLGDDERPTSTGNDQAGVKKKDDGEVQSGPFGELLEVFGQIQLNKDFYESIARTESCAGLGPAAVASRADLERASFAAAVGAATATLRRQVETMSPSGREPSLSFLQAYAVKAISAFAGQDESSYSGEDLSGSADEPSVGRPDTASGGGHFEANLDQVPNSPQPFGIEEEAIVGAHLEGASQDRAPFGMRLHSPACSWDPAEGSAGGGNRSGGGAHRPISRPLSDAQLEAETSETGGMAMSGGNASGAWQQQQPFGRPCSGEVDSSSGALASRPAAQPGKAAAVVEGGGAEVTMAVAAERLSSPGNQARSPGGGTAAADTAASPPGNKILRGSPSAAAGGAFGGILPANAAVARLGVDLEDVLGTSPALGSGRRTAPGSATAPQREKREQQRPGSSSGPSRTSNDPPKRQKKGPGLVLPPAHAAGPEVPAVMGTSVRGGGTPSPPRPLAGEAAVEPTLVPRSPAAQSPGLPTAALSQGSVGGGTGLAGGDNGGVDKQGAVSGEEEVQSGESGGGEEAEDGSSFEEAAPAAWGSSLVCADLTLHDVASKYWPALVKRGESSMGHEESAPLSSKDIILVERFMEELEGAIRDAYANAPHPRGSSRWRLSAQAKCLATATAFDELLRERQGLRPTSANAAMSGDMA